MGHKTRKDRRKEYTGFKRVDTTCRNHGTCRSSRNNRTYFDQKYRQAADMDLREHFHPRFSSDTNDFFWEEC